MKKLTIASLLLLTLATNKKGITQTLKLPRDSVRYYQKELNQLWKSTYDSLKNSDRYKEINSKLDIKNRQKTVTVELLANLGLYFTDFKNLNARLKSIGQNEIKTMVPSAGASLAIGYPIMTYGLELAGYVFDNSTASFKGVHGRFFLATNLFKKSAIVLNPQVGIAGSFLNMFIHKSAPQTSFNTLFSGQGNTINLTHSQNYLDFALGLKFRPPKSENFYWQFFRAGYRYALKDVAWKMRGGDIIDAPVDRNNQFYFQLCLGFDR
jgi:hypothetical protein